MSTSEKSLSPKELEREYFKQADDWNIDVVIKTKKSEKRAWFLVISLLLIAALEAIAIFSLMPLQKIEPFVIRVDNSTGIVDVISTVTETDGEIKESAQEVVDKYWLGQYIKFRESYLFQTMDYDRKMVGLFSDSPVQQAYARYTDPNQNINAPIEAYGEAIELVSKVKSISFIGSSKEKGTRTAIVQYYVTRKQQGDYPKTVHWAATVTYRYLNIRMSLEDRALNPMGFQVVSYRDDQESVGVSK